MDINEGIRLVTHYIKHRKGVDVDINAVNIMMDNRQKELLAKAVKVAVEYHNGTNIII
jgi:hypothetical protein